jgi:hypothetical protein
MMSTTIGAYIFELHLNNNDLGSGCNFSPGGPCDGVYQIRSAVTGALSLKILFLACELVDTERSLWRLYRKSDLGYTNESFFRRLIEYPAIFYERQVKANWWLTWGVVIGVVATICGILIPGLNTEVLKQGFLHGEQWAVVIISFMVYVSLTWTYKLCKRLYYRSEVKVPAWRTKRGYFTRRYILNPIRRMRGLPEDNKEQGWEQGDYAVWEVLMPVGPEKPQSGRFSRHNTTRSKGETFQV